VESGATVRYCSITELAALLDEDEDEDPANKTEPSTCGGDAAFRQITRSIYLLLSLYIKRGKVSVRAYVRSYVRNGGRGQLSSE